jgi:hypothetical protein
MVKTLRSRGKNGYRDTEVEKTNVADRTGNALVAVNNNIDIYQGPPTKSEGSIYETATE